MALFTPDITFTFLISFVLILFLIYLITINIRRYFKIVYSKSLLAILISLLFLFISLSSDIASLFVPEGNMDLFLLLNQFNIVAYIISIYCLLLFYEMFENETIFTQQQSLVTILFTVIVILIQIGLPQSKVLWLMSSEHYIINLDSVSNILSVIFPLIIGILIISNLRKGLKDVWISQRAQLMIILLSVVLITFLGFIIRVIFILNSISNSPLTGVIVRMPSVIGYGAISFSFGNLNDFSRYYRQKADKLIVTNLNGIPLFVYDFKENVHYIDETLFSGAMVAITMLLSESIKASSPIAEVLMKNRYRLLLETKQSFIALLLTPRGNNYLRDSLIRFSTAFDTKFTSIITSGEILDLNLFVKSGIKVLFQAFGISIKDLDQILKNLVSEETYS